VTELDIRGILAALVEEGVEFLVIGGLAVGYHGYVRATKDVDVVPNPDPDNLVRLARALDRLDAHVEGVQEFNDQELPDPLDPDALGLGGNWVLETRLGRLDVMQWIGDEALWGQLAGGAVEDEIAGLRVSVVGYDDLVKLKHQAGRPEDMLDLERLSQARED
jgi:predicted nucleotidyltransferase